MGVRQNPAKLAVIGAGLAGLTAAERMAAAGHDVTVFEKSRGLGGRLATRRLTDDHHADHGAQYFSLRDPVFTDWVGELTGLGLADQWEARFVKTEEGGELTPLEAPSRYVFTPAMNGAMRHLARSCTLHTGTQIDSVAHESAWTLVDTEDEAYGPFDWLVVAIPAPQALALLGAFEEVARALDGVTMIPCLAAMMAFDGALGVAADGIEFSAGPLAWAARNTTKPGRPAGEAWVVHAGTAWSVDHLDWEKDAIAEALWGEFRGAFDLASVTPDLLSGHRWRYAFAGQVLSRPILTVDDAPVVLCGDWCLGPRLDNAWSSGGAAASYVLAAVA
ncbi:MAG: FAD-dependent oxidoreductase [Pseudomonadota bacterium]